MMSQASHVCYWKSCAVILNARRVLTRGASINSSAFHEARMSILGSKPCVFCSLSPSECLCPANRMDCQSPEYDVKEDIGSAQCPIVIGSSPMSAPHSSRMSMDSKSSEVVTPITITGKSSVLEKENSHSRRSSPVSPTVVMQSLRDRKRRKTTASKTIPALKALASKWALDHSEEMNPSIGNESGNSPNEEASWKCRPIYVFRIIVPCARSALILRLLRNLSGMCIYIGDDLVVEKVDEPGWKLALELTARTPAPNFSAGTEVKKKLLSMSFEEESISHTFSDGLTVIQSTWNLKDHLRL